MRMPRIHECALFQYSHIRNIRAPISSIRIMDEYLLSKQCCFNNYNKSPEGKHEEKGDDAVDGNLAPLGHLFRVSRASDILVDAPDEHHKRDADKEWDDKIRHVGEFVREGPESDAGCGGIKYLNGSLGGGGKGEGEESIEYRV